MTLTILLSFFTIPIFLFISFKIAKIINLYDHPNQKRKIHVKPVLLVGGIFFEIIFLSYFILLSFFNILNIDNYLLLDTQNSIVLLTTLSVVFAIGLYDDKKNIQPIIKLVLIFIIFSISLSFIDNTFIIQNLKSFFKQDLQLNSYSIFFTAFCFTVLLNAINMADGINSLSSMIFIIWIFCLNLITPTTSIFFLINIVSVYALIIFAALNYQNKFFLGDSGCYVLITYVSFLTVYIYNMGLSKNLNYLNVESIFLLFMIPGVDMLRLFFKRSINKKNPFEADNNHLHHILIKRLGNFNTLVIYGGSIFIPWILYYFFISLLPYLIIFSLLIYIFLIQLKKDNHETN